MVLTILRCNVYIIMTVKPEHIYGSGRVDINGKPTYTRRYLGY